MIKKLQKLKKIPDASGLVKKLILQKLRRLKMK